MIFFLFVNNILYLCAVKNFIKRMSTKYSIWQNPDYDDAVDVLDEKSRHLVLHNDDVNTFDHVITSLVEICSHEIVQAEQCAYIVHFNGKCDIKTGTYEALYPVRDKLISKGLSVTID